jgi:hypothetical protein
MINGYATGIGKMGEKGVFGLSYVENGIVSVRDDYYLSEKITLTQNYPNPFNPVTTITYEIPFIVGVKSSRLVTLKIFDIMGNEVTTLVNDYHTAGSYSIDFQPRNLVSGIYFYQLNSGTTSISKKMIYLK